MRGIDQLIELNTGGSKTGKVEKELELTIKLLFQKKMERSDLINELELEKHYADPGKKLDDLLAILRGKDMEIGVRALMTDTISGDKYYWMSKERMLGNIDQIKRNMAYVEESQEIRENLDELKAEIRDLR